MRSSFTLLLLVVLTACSSQAASNSGSGGGGGSPPDDGSPVLIIANGSGDGPGISVADALTHAPTDDLVTVTGSLFVDAAGDVLLCDAIAESFPPQCGGARITVQGLDLSTVPDVQAENGVRWAESVILFGSVE